MSTAMPSRKGAVPIPKTRPQVARSQAGITLTPELQSRMQEFKRRYYINWSAVACEAFARVMDEAEAKETQSR